MGKSTVFNALTGLNQHTAIGLGRRLPTLRAATDMEGEFLSWWIIPGTYSLMANSLEEEVARDFICFGEPDHRGGGDGSTCLERNLNLWLQMLEVTGRMVVCVNLMDEAKKKGITIDLAVLSRELGYPWWAPAPGRAKGCRI